MDTLKLEPGDFMKNAGIVGFLRMMEIHRNKGGNESKQLKSVQVEYDIAELLEMDLAQMYIDAFVEIHGEETNTFKQYQRMEILLQKLKTDENLVFKEIKIDWEDISKELLWPHCTDGLKSAGRPEVIDWLKDLEISEEFFRDRRSDFIASVERISSSLTQPSVKKILLFKAVMYEVICHFWGGSFKKVKGQGYKFDRQQGLKSIFHKNMRTSPIRDAIQKEYINPIAKKPPVRVDFYCIDCGQKITKSIGREISLFLNIADDLSRKTSAFWNCKPDGYLCPICTFLYILAPLGFVRVENGDFMFINSNTDVQMLYDNNMAKLKEEETAPSWQQRLNQAIGQLLQGKEKVASNIQVITRSSQENKYRFNVIGRELVEILQKARKPLDFLNEQSSVRLANGDYINVYQECLLNVLNYRDQYNLLHQLVMVSMKQGGVNRFLWHVLKVQCQQLLLRKEHSMELDKQQYYAAKSGAELRNLLVSLKAGGNAAAFTDDKKEDLIRGTVYQLTNALKVQDREQFIDLIIRIYSSCKKPIPTVFLSALQDTDTFTFIGYAFIIGLKGGFYENPNKTNQQN
ncbi:MAG: type I-B CRISPR-associated protein Cas8b1/Cst1 [Planctomycetia bacterium]|nr:type I-B CRISPR-associated protein Cas8b1/Cst1 [Planctomycetia bacterium]